MTTKKEELIEEMRRYVQAESELKKIERDMAFKIQDVEAEYQDKIKKCLHIQATASESLQTAAFYHYDEFFSAEKSIDLQYGIIGFRKGKHKVVKHGRRNWDELCALCEVEAPEFLRLKKELDKAKILTAKDNVQCMERLKQIGISVVQDEYFFLRTYEG